MWYHFIVRYAVCLLCNLSIYSILTFAFWWFNVNLIHLVIEDDINHNTVPVPFCKRLLLTKNQSSSWPPGQEWLLKFFWTSCVKSSLQASAVSTSPVTACYIASIATNADRVHWNPFFFVFGTFLAAELLKWSTYACQCFIFTRLEAQVSGYWNWPDTHRFIGIGPQQTFTNEYLLTRFASSAFMNKASIAVRLAFSIEAILHPFIIRNIMWRNKKILCLARSKSLKA